MKAKAAARHQLIRSRTRESSVFREAEEVSRLPLRLTEEVSRLLLRLTSLASVPSESRRV